MGQGRMGMSRIDLRVEGKCSGGGDDDYLWLTAVIELIRFVIRPFDPINQCLELYLYIVIMINHSSWGTVWRVTENGVAPDSLAGELERWSVLIKTVA